MTERTHLSTTYANGYAITRLFGDQLVISYANRPGVPTEEEAREIAAWYWKVLGVHGNDPDTPEPPEPLRTTRKRKLTAI